MTWLVSFKNAMKRHRWTIAELNRRTGIARQTLQNWMAEAGGRGEPRISECLKLAKVMNLSLDELFRGRISSERMEDIFRRAIDEAQEALQADLLDRGGETGTPARSRRG